MPKREIEGDFVMGWPDRKRLALLPGKDSEGRIINGRAPLTELQGLLAECGPLSERVHDTVKGKLG